MTPLISHPPPSPIANFIMRVRTHLRIPGQIFRVRPWRRGRLHPVSTRAQIVGPCTGRAVRRGVRWQCLRWRCKSVEKQSVEECGRRQNSVDPDPPLADRVSPHHPNPPAVTQPPPPPPPPPPSSSPSPPTDPSTHPPTHPNRS